MGPGALRGRAIARIAALAACGALSLASLAASQTLSEQRANGQTQTGNGQNGKGQNGTGQNGNGQNGNASRLVETGAGPRTMNPALVQAYQSNPPHHTHRA